MLKTHWPMFVCTLAIIGTLIGCTYWVADVINNNGDFIQRSIERGQPS